MNYEQENQQIKQCFLQLFELAKLRCGTWAEVAARLDCDYRVVARHRRHLSDPSDNSYPAFLFFWRLCKIVGDRDLSFDDLGHLFSIYVTKVSREKWLTISKGCFILGMTKARRIVEDDNHKKKNKHCLLCRQDDKRTQRSA